VKAACKGPEETLLVKRRVKVAPRLNILLREGLLDEVARNAKLGTDADGKILIDAPVARAHLLETDSS